MNEIKINLADDSFIHFTLEDRAKEIIKEGKLLSNPPYKTFGISGVQAISVTHGEYVPSVQTTHIERGEESESDEVVAILFKTNTMPKVGYPEEVIWPENKNVNLINPKIISQEEAIRLLKPKSEEDKTLIYESLLASLIKS